MMNFRNWFYISVVHKEYIGVKFCAKHTLYMVKMDFKNVNPIPAGT